MARCTDEEGLRSTPRDAGFSLVELVVVVVIIGVLAGVAIPRTQTAVTRARATALVNDLRTVRQAAHEYRMEHGSWPPATEEGRIPDGLEEYLPDGFSFQGPRARVAFVNHADDRIGEWGEGVGVGVRIVDDPALQAALRRILASRDASGGSGEGGGVALWEPGGEAEVDPDGSWGGGFGGTARGGPPSGGQRSRGSHSADLSVPSLLEVTGRNR